METLTSIIATLAILAPGVAWIYSKMREYSKENDTLRTQINEMREQILVLQAQSRKDILAKWVKNSAGQYVWVNEVYVTKFLAPLRLDAGAVLGRTDDELDFYTDELKETLRVLDGQVRDKGFATAHGVRFRKDSTHRYTIIKELAVDSVEKHVTFYGTACEEG